MKALTVLGRCWSGHEGGAVCQGLHGAADLHGARPLTVRHESVKPPAPWHSFQLVLAAIGEIEAGADHDVPDRL